MSRSRIFHLYGDVTITGEGLQNLGLISALGALEQGGIYHATPSVTWDLVFVFFISSKGPPHLVTFYDSQGDTDNLF
jgi:hypothetical protein